MFHKACKGVRDKCRSFAVRVSRTDIVQERTEGFIDYWKRTVRYIYGIEHDAGMTEGTKLSYCIVLHHSSAYVQGPCVV